VRILINALSARLGGGQTYLLNFLQNMPEDACLDVLVLAPDQLALPEHPNLRRVNPRWPVTNPVSRTLWERIALPALLRRERVDVLFCPGGVIATKPPHGCRTATMFRNMIPFDKRVRASIPMGLQRVRNWLLYRVMLSSMSSADLTIFISDHARSVIEKLVPIRRAVTLPHGIGGAFRTYGLDLPRPDSLPPGSYILYVSRFDVYKHHYEVVMAYSTLSAAVRAEARLVLVGECGTKEASRVIALISELGLEEQVIITGPIPYAELPAVYKHARLIIFASSCENCPNILLEALGAGRPIASSDVMPMPEFGGDAVAYFSPFDPADIAAAMLRLLTDESLARELASKAGKRSEQYDWAETARATWHHLRDLGGNARSVG
jgi:glycosyltransferase involved in cell wall biosynthesis